MEAKPRPVIGAVLGVMLGLVTTVLLAVLGVVPPERLIVFGLTGTTMIVVAILLTQRLVLAKKRIIVIVILGVLSIGFGLSGIPQFAGGGDLQGGCTAQGMSSLEPAWVTPQQTSAMNPFDIARDDTVDWEATSGDLIITDWISIIGADIGGFSVRVWDGDHPNSGEATEWDGSEDVGATIEEIESTYPITVSGVVRVDGGIAGDGGFCDGSAYVRIAPESAFDGTLLVTLWILLVIIVILIIVMIIVVRRSISAADQAAGGPGDGPVPADSAPVPPSAGGAAAGAAAASDEETPAERYERDMKHFDDLDRQDDADNYGRNKALGEQVNDGRMDRDTTMEAVEETRNLGDLLENDSSDAASGAGAADGDSDSDTKE